MCISMWRLGAVGAMVVAATSLSAPRVRAQVAGDPVGVMKVVVAPVDTGRPHAVEYSDWYYRRLTVHRIASYTMLPMFAAEYYVGDRLLREGNPPGWVRPAHGVIASGIDALFTVNTITGAWNLWDARHDSNDRTRRYLHAGLMLASDAGFVWTGATTRNAHQSLSGARQHRDIAVGSISLSTVGTVMMWLWKN